MTDLGAKEIAKTNMNLLKSSVFNPGFKSIFSPITGATNQREIESLEKEIKEEKERLRRRSTATPPPGGGGPTGNTGNVPPRGRQTGGGPT